MMMSEFIERVGFEPTAAEYQEIEREYMGCDVDKDQFCKECRVCQNIMSSMECELCVNFDMFVKVEVEE